jgi:hypothetical protein
VAPNLHALDSADAPKGASSGSVKTRVDASSEPVNQDEGLVFCLACDQLITDLGQRIRVQDAHEHRFMNPAGELFHLGCFAEAIGCRVVGPDSWEYPWFAGFAWRFADCGGCGRQLGWSFRSDADTASGAPTSFFGLVLDRLRFASGPG